MPELTPEAEIASLKRKLKIAARTFTLLGRRFGILQSNLDRARDLAVEQIKHEEGQVTPTEAVPTFEKPEAQP